MTGGPSHPHLSYGYGYPVDDRLARYDNDILEMRIRELQEQLARMEGRYLALMEEHVNLKLVHEKCPTEIKSSRKPG